MSRRSLRPQLNQIRGWVRQGRTDAWIAHQLEVTVQQIQAFKREHELTPDGDGEATAEVDLRASDDAAIAAELEAEAEVRAAEEARKAEEEAAEAARKAEEEARAQAARAAEKATRAPSGEDEGDDAASGPGDEDEEGARPRRRRSRGGRSRRRSAGQVLEGTFDHGEEGYGLWLDPAIEDDPVYAEHWAGHRPVVVTIEEDQIVIRRAGADEDDDD
jgi:hypothetical protein